MAASPLKLSQLSHRYLGQSLLCLPFLEARCALARRPLSSAECSFKGSTVQCELEFTSRRRPEVFVVVASLLVVVLLGCVRVILVRS